MEAARPFPSCNRMRLVVARELRCAVEQAHGCKAMPVDEVTVHEKRDGETLWHGVVVTYKLDRHPTAKLAYGWFYELPGKREFLSVLHAGPITGPAEAVRAALAKH
jgi:hypothetical protein